LFLRVLDPYQASYGVKEPIFAVTQLAQTTMRSEIGKMTLDKTFEERDTMNAAIVSIVNEAAQAWGVQVLRYEIRDIIPPPSIKQAMEMQAEAERRRRAEVLQSEGDRQSEVNLAQGRRQAAILRAEGEAQAIAQGCGRGQRAGPRRRRPWPRRWRPPVWRAPLTPSMAKILPVSGENWPTCPFVGKMLRLSS